MGLSIAYGTPPDRAQAIDLIRAAFERGVTFFDTAEVYGAGANEELLGEAVAPFRDAVVLATKFGFADAKVGAALDSRPERIRSVLDASLRRLRTDRIDLFQLHAYDAGTPIDEVLSTLDTLVAAGKVRYVGVSNFSGWQLMKSLDAADRNGWPRYVAHQVYYSLVGRDYEWDLMPLGAAEGVGAIVWSPLGWGRLTGKIRRGAPIPPGSRLHRTAEFGPPVDEEVLYDVVDVLTGIAEETGRSVPQVALNWLLTRPTVASVIVGARDAGQLRQNLGAVGWSLTDDQVARLDRASARSAPYPHFPYRRQEGFARLNPPLVG